MHNNTMLPEIIRTFIAIELPTECITEIREFQSKFKSQDDIGIKWVDPGSIHITLKFLADVNIKHIEGINKSLANTAMHMAQFTLNISGAGFFPDAKRMRVFWLGLKGDTDRLISFQSSIDNSISQLGFLRERRSFEAHLTLARFNDNFDQRHRDVFAERVNKIEFYSDTQIVVDSVCLIRSQLTPKGAIYTLLAKHQFKGL